jgi:hypothetical protein
MLIAMFILPSAYAQQYYADVIFDVHTDGSVDISGSTNHPSIYPASGIDDFTSKNKRFWVLNISIEDDFSQYIVEIKFPVGASLNYFKASNVLSIVDDDGRIVVIITGTQEPMQFLAQYSFDEDINSSWSWLTLDVLIAVALIIFLFAAVVVLIHLLKTRSLKKGLFSERKFSFLTGRQRMIVDMLLKNNGKLTQAVLEKELKIPKSSLSRNVESLVRKGIISKEAVGMSNMLRLTPDSGKGANTTFKV